MSKKEDEIEKIGWESDWSEKIADMLFGLLCSSFVLKINYKFLVLSKVNLMV